MCTVTFLPLKNSILFTSNRDELLSRPAATLPEAYAGNTGKLLYPKDGQAGGTWIAMHGNGKVMVLLNGAFVRHKPKPPYRLSRGLVFIKIFDSPDSRREFERIDLQGIEPFTLVLWQQTQLWEARWDGIDKYLIPLPATRPAIWSSSTLYDEEVILRRKQWFKQWLSQTKNITSEKIRLFHEMGGEGDERNDLRMNRDGKLSTISITGIELLATKAIMHYRDLKAGLQSVNEWHYLPNTTFKV
jgi:hypothetical protein